MLVVERRRDRLELERHFPEAARSCDRRQCVLGRGVRRVVVVDEAHGAAEHRLVDLASQIVFRPAPEKMEERPQHVGEGDRMDPDPRLLVNQRRPQNALQRSHQASVFAADIGLDRRAAEPRPRVVERKEYGAGQRRLAQFQPDQTSARAIGDADRRIRGAKIHAQKIEV